MDIMLIDIHCFDAVPDGIDPSISLVSDDFEDAYVDRVKNERKATLILFGRCSDGKSICLSVEKYEPWFRLKILTRPEKRRNDYSEESLYVSIGKLLNLEYGQMKIVFENLPQFYGFEEDNGNIKQFKCVKVYVPTFYAVQKFQRAHTTNSYFSDMELTDFMTPVTIKALNEIKLQPSSWFHIEHYEKCKLKISTCDLEYNVSVSDISPRPLMTSIAPIKIISFDAEMYSHDNGFPEVIHGDITIAICATIKVYGSDILKRKAFVVYDKTLSVSCDIEYFDSSHEMLEGFRDFIVSEDPDLLTGWNIYGFDMPFLSDQYASSYVSRPSRGSEALHSKCLSKLGLKGFLTTAELLAKCKHSQNTVLREQIEKLDMRWRVNLQKPDKLPEAIAEPIRSSLRKLLNLPTEVSLGLVLSGQFEALKNYDRVNAVMGPPRYVDNFKKFELMSRLCCERSQLQEKRMSSAAKGDNTYYFWSSRSCVDLMQIIKDDKKLEDNTLKFTAQTYLDPEFGKIDMTPAEIFAAYRTKDPIKMASMIEYCIRDADIPILLLDKLCYIPQWIEMSRVSFTPVGQVLNGGQQRKVYNLIAHFVHDTHALNKAQSGWPVGDVEEDDTALGEIADSMKKRKADYQGATVIEPQIGYYTNSISTLDFESLYPSIIIHFNLCPSVYAMKPVSSKFTLETHDIHHVILKDAKKNEYEEFSRSYGFVKNVQGIIPKLLQHLLSARKLAKRAMASATNEFERSVQNGRQLALKVSCNSVYGFFGVGQDRGLMSCKPVAAVTTLRGRAFIEASKKFVEKTYKASVIYGDTDSIMINWGPGIDVPQAYRLAEEASGKITDLLRHGLVEGASKPLLDSAAAAITLANEKVYNPYLLIQKKTYAGFKYQLKSNRLPGSLDDFETCIDMKGIDAVRRDRSKLVKHLSERVLNALLIHSNLELAVQEIKDTVAAVAAQKAPLEFFILSKSLKTSYASENQPHVQAWKRMIERGDQDIPEVGTRMPYVITVSKGRAGPLYERTEHPDFVRRKALQYCAKYYLENAQDVILRLLGPTGSGPRISQFFSDALVAAETKVAGNMSLLSFKKMKTSQGHDILDTDRS